MIPYIGEYKRYRRLLEGSLRQLTDDEFFRVLSPSSNSVAIILKHISGNWHSRFTNFLTSDGEKPWRNRESEFDVTGLSREELMAYWQGAWDILETNVFALGEADMKTPITIRGVTLSVEEALCRSLSHFSYHVGEIVFLAKHFKGDDWEYLSIAPGKSDEYNANPTSEVLRS